MHINKQRIFLIVLAFIASLGGFLFGYDTAVISGTLSFVTQQFDLSAGLEGWYVGSALIGSIIGVAFAGWLSDKYGRKMTLLLCGLLFSISAIGCAISGGFSGLVIYRLIGGMGVGIASMLSPLYISEISPPKIRGRLVALYQLAIAIGILCSYFVNAYLLQASSIPGYEQSATLRLVFKEEVWRAMLGMEAIPALSFFILIIIIPKSPRWLVVKGKVEEAKGILRKIVGEDEATTEINEIRETLALESEKGSWKMILEPGIKMAVLIGVALAILQQYTGIDSIIYYGPRIMEQAGFGIGEALGGQVLIGIINVLFTLLAIWKIDHFGRRPIMIAGTIGMLISLTAIGFLFMLDKAEGLLLISFIMVFIACFAFSLGPVVWVILSEIYPTKIRGRAMSIATMGAWIGMTTIGFIIPVSLDSIGPAYTFWIFALFCLPTIYIGLKLVPETKGKTLEEIERHWLKY
ncbi:sugar porter family MFS transporter [Bacteroidota bacterium]